MAVPVAGGTTRTLASSAAWLLASPPVTDSTSVYWTVVLLDEPLCRHHHENGPQVADAKMKPPGVQEAHTLRGRVVQIPAFVYPVSVSLGMALAACSRADEGTDSGAFANDAATADGGQVSDGTSSADYNPYINAPDGGPWCSSPIGDAGFSTLAEVPVAELCQYSNVPNLNVAAYESAFPCQGFMAVWAVNSSADYSDVLWWLFDATTGELRAFGENGTCAGAVPGFQAPWQCFVYRGWPEATNLCGDAGPQVNVPPP
jgi:hypothetical protein